MKTMPNGVTGPKSKKASELKAEYKFDYSRAQPNRFAGWRAKSQVVVLLDP